MPSLLPVVVAANELYKCHEKSRWTVFSKTDKLDSLATTYADIKPHEEKELALEILRQLATDTYIQGHLKAIYDVLAKNALLVLEEYELTRKEQDLVNKIATYKYTHGAALNNIHHEFAHVPNESAKFTMSAAKFHLPHQREIEKRQHEAALVLAKQAEDRRVIYHQQKQIEALNAETIKLMEEHISTLEQHNSIIDEENQSKDEVIELYNHNGDLKAQVTDLEAELALLEKQKNDEIAALHQSQFRMSVDLTQAEARLSQVLTENQALQREVKKEQSSHSQLLVSRQLVKELEEKLAKSLIKLSEKDVEIQKLKGVKNTASQAVEQKPEAKENASAKNVVSFANANGMFAASKTVVSAPVSNDQGAQKKRRGHH